MPIIWRKENIVQKHKWYNEIVAWASGAEIEFAYSVVSDFAVWNTRQNQDWDDARFIFRIKPQPEEPQYLYVYRTSTNGQIEYRIYHDKDAAGALLGKIKLEQDE